MTFRREVGKLGLALVAIALVGVVGVPAAQAQAVCENSFAAVATTCALVTSVSTDTEDGGTATVSCTYEEGVPEAEREPCMVTACEEFIANDAIHAASGGLAWDPSKPWQQPEAGATAGGIGGLVVQLIEDAFIGEDTRELGYFSGTGQWIFCQEVNHWNPDPISPYGSTLLAGGANDARFVPVDGEINADDLYDQAYADATPTDPEINFAPADLAVVQMPAWFWVGEYWHDWEATAADGRIAVRVRAEPQNTVWETGESTIDCVGEEENKDAWRSGLDPWSDSDCSYIYENSTVITPSGFYDLTATTHYLAWFDLFVDGAIGLTEPIPQGYEASSSQPLEVEEILSVAVSPARALTPSEPLTQE